MPTIYQPTYVNVDYFKDAVVATRIIVSGRTVQVSDSLNNWNDNIQLNLINTFLQISDDNSANWSDAFSLINYIAWSASGNLNNWSDVNERFMTRRLQIVDTNLDNLLDSFQIKEFQNFSDDLNNWGDTSVVSRDLVLVFSDTTTMSDVFVRDVAGKQSLSDTLALSDSITLRLEKKLNLLDDNSFNWNNLFVFLKS